MSGVDLQAIYNRLNAVPRYHPMSANTFADWAMEAGDIVTVSRGGTSYQSPVGTSTLKWNGKQQVQISSEGSKERDAISRISARKYAKGGGGGSGMRGTQELYWEMFSEDGRLHAVISATAESLVADYTEKIDDVDDALEGKITATASQLRTEYTDRINNTQTQINQNASTLSLAVGRVKYNSTAHYANKSSFPSTGTAGVLYYADDTGKAYLYMPGTHSYELATVDEFGNANYLKAGEIALSINESGETTAKLDADRVLVGKGAQTIDDLDLPDWMDTTTGLIATKATIQDLQVLTLRVDTLAADSITTKNMQSVDAMFSSVGARDIAASGSLSIKDGNSYYAVQRSISDLQIVSSGNTYTLQYKKWSDSNWTDVSQSFSRAVSSVAWSWSGGMAKAVLTPQGQTFYSKQLDAIQPHGQQTWDNDNKGFTVTLDVDDTDGTTAYSEAVHFSTLTSYNAGVTEGEGHFTLTTVTTAVNGNYITPIISDNYIQVSNALRYTEGTPYTHYAGGGWFSYQDVGNTTVYSRSHMVKLTYIGTISGQSGYYYKVDANGTAYYQTAEYSPTTRTGYRRGDQIDGVDQGSPVAVWVPSTSGTKYYRDGTTVYRYSASNVSNTYYTKS